MRMNKALRRILSWMLALSMVLSLIPAAHASGLRWEKTDTEITAELSSRPVEQKETARQDPDEQIRVSIVPEQPSAVQAA